MSNREKEAFVEVIRDLVAQVDLAVRGLDGYFNDGQQIRNALRGILVKLDSV